MNIEHPTHDDSSASDTCHATFYVPVQLFKLNELHISLFSAPEYSKYPILIILTSGTLLLRIDNKQSIVSAPAVISSPNTASLKPLEDSPSLGVIIQYQPVSFSKHDPLPITFEPLSATKSIISLTYHLEAAWHADRSRLHVHKLFLELLEQIELLVDQNSPRKKDWLEEILHFIHNHFMKELSRESLAARACVSPEHFSRAFRKYTGCTLNVYVNTLRIRHVQQQLLLGSQHNLQEIALKVGYKDGYYLSRKFKQVVGSAPTIFVRKPKRIVAANYNYTAMLLALQEQPVYGAYSTWMLAMQPNLPADQQNELFSTNGCDYYRLIHSLKPDVIIGYSELANDAKLAQLAPIIGLPFLKLDWREQFRMIADIVDKMRMAELLLEQYDEQVAHANRRLDQELGQRGSLIMGELHQNKACVFGRRFGRGTHVLYDDLGFHMPKPLLHSDVETRGYIYTSMERFCTFSADFMIVTETAAPSERQTKAYYDRHMQTAGKQRKLVVANPSDLFYGFDPLSTQKQLEVLVNVLIS